MPPFNRSLKLDRRKSRAINLLNANEARGMAYLSVPNGGGGAQVPSLTPLPFFATTLLIGYVAHGQAVLKLII